MLAVTEKLSWYVTRSSGLVAWALVTASILWGLTLSSRLVRRRGVPAWLLAVHKYLGTLSIVFVVVHLLALVADNYVYFSWSELFVPLATTWRPGPTAWGIVGFYLLIAIQVSSWLMRRMPRRVWHSIHLTSVVLFVAATVHGFQSGADRSNRLVQWAALVGSMLVVTLLVFRLLTRTERGRGRRSRTPDPSRAAKRPAVDANAGELPQSAAV